MLQAVTTMMGSLLQLKRATRMIYGNNRHTRGYEMDGYTFRYMIKHGHKWAKTYITESL